MVEGRKGESKHIQSVPYCREYSRLHAHVHVYIQGGASVEVSGGACDFVIPFSFHQNLCITQSNKSTFHSSNTDVNDLAGLEYCIKFPHQTTSPSPDNRHHEASSNVQAEHQREHTLCMTIPAKPY